MLMDKIVIVPVQEGISSLFDLQINAHVRHLQSNSFAEHMALNGLYEGLPGLIDSFVEAWQGKFGIVKGYSKIVDLKEFETKGDFIAYLENKLRLNQQFNASLGDSYMIQLADNISELLVTTLYKLKQLN